MTITPYAAGSLSQFSGPDFVSLRGQLDDLSRQLSTGQKAQSYGGLGTERRTSLDARGEVAAIDGYLTAIDAANVRLGVMTNGIQQLSSAVDDLKAGLAMGSFEVGLDGKTTTQTTAAAQFRFALDVLNSDVDGRYLFGGRVSDRPPVAAADKILDGDTATGRAGLKQLIAERTAADLGAGATKLGRLSLGYASGTTGVTLTESADAETRANFGFVIAGATSSNPSGIAVTSTAGSPASVALSFATKPNEGDAVRVYVARPDGGQDILDLTARSSPAPGSPSEFAIGADAAATAANLQALLAGRNIASVQSANPPAIGAAFSGGTPAGIAFDVAAQPNDGDVVRVTLALRDGTSTTLELSAARSPGADPNAFAIGSTPAETAANLAATLSGAIDRAARTTLAAASAQVAAADLFAGSATPGREPRRIGGSPPFEAATGFAPASPGRTVLWYTGDDAAPSARGTAVVQVGKGQIVALGAQANEPAFRSALAQFAVLAATTFTASPDDQGRYDALTQRVGSALAPTGNAQTLGRMGTELGQASSVLGAAKDRHADAKAFLESAIQGVEGTNDEQVAAEILALQTRLQASYRTTSLLAHLSMVEYL